MGRTTSTGQRAACAAAAALSCLCALSCAAPKHLMTARWPAEPLPVRLLAIYPFTYTYDNQPCQSYEKTWDAVAIAAGAGRFLVLDPTEFTIYQNRPENAFASSTLVAKAARLKVRPEEIAVLRARAERRVTEGKAAIFDAQGRRAGGDGSKAEVYILRVEIIHPSSGGTLVSLEQLFTRDPSGGTPPWDNNPELTEIHRALAARAVGELAAHATAARLPAPPAFGYRVNHHGVFRYSLPEGVSLDASAKGLDIVEKEALRRARYQYFDADMATAQFELYERHPYGLLVTTVDDPALAAAGLKPGDLILKINKRRMTGAHKLWRSFRRDPCVKPVTLTVARGGETLTLTHAGACAAARRSP